MVSDNMNHWNRDIEDLARALYYAFKTEEDAFEAGLYQMLISDKQKYAKYGFERVLDEYTPYAELKSLLRFLEDIDHNDRELNQSLKETFGLSTSQVFSKLKTAQVRHKRKALKVYNKFRKEVTGVAEARKRQIINHITESVILRLRRR